jgi:polysaccharide export outer membrane protein
MFSRSKGRRDAGRKGIVAMACHRRYIRLILALWLAATSIVAPASDKAKSKEPASPETQLPDYVIGLDDLLVINVWKEPEISRSVPVRPDGKISLPLVGDLRANGRTVAQLQDDIKQQLLTYLSNPAVTVIVQEAKSQKFNVLGEVEHPGCYVLSRSLTVLDAIAIAGGFRGFAKTGKIYVLRINADGSHTRIAFNYKDVIKGRNLSQNVDLQARDTVVVP